MFHEQLRLRGNRAVQADFPVYIITMKKIKYFLLILIFPLFLSNSCQATNFGNNNNEMISLYYPVVLVHGIIARDSDSFIGFWGRIPDTLRNKGVMVYFGNTDAFGSIESNAAFLKDTIETVLKETGAQKVNIIAHSKGGIDSRYMIWKYDFGDKVASLSTINTPHYGAEIADIIASQNIFKNSYNERMILTVFSKLYGDRNPDMYTVLNQLTTEHMSEFNQEVTPDERVYYQTFYTSMKSGFDDLIFFYTFQYIRIKTGENDGVVSAKSAQWGRNARKLSNSSISHRQIIDVEFQSNSNIVPDLYVYLANDLSRKGF
jgi:triacylglycerol lipase